MVVFVVDVVAVFSLFHRDCPPLCHRRLVHHRIRDFHRRRHRDRRSRRVHHNIKKYC